MTKQTIAILSLLLVMLIWGSSFTVTKAAVEQIPSILFAFLRFLTASVLLVIYFAVNRRKIIKPTKTPWGILILMGITGIGAYYTFFNVALEYTSASITALIQGFIPVVIAILAAIFLKERLSFIQVIGILISVTGVVFIGFIAHSATPVKDAFLGNSLVVLTVISWSSYTILSKKLSRFDPVYVTTYSAVIGTVILFFCTLIQLWNRPVPHITAGGWAAVLYLGSMASAVSYLLYNKALQGMGAAQVGNYINLDPVIGAVIAMIFLGEKISLAQAIGSLFVLGGVWLSSMGSKQIKNNQHIEQKA